MDQDLLVLTRLFLKPVSHAPPLLNYLLKPRIHSSQQKIRFFPLPTESRLQIWTTSLLTARIIAVTQTPLSKNRFQPRFTSLSGAPVLLSTNRESRALATSIQHQGKLEYIFAIGNPKLYLGPEIDTLYFNGEASRPIYPSATPPSKMY